MAMAKKVTFMRWAPLIIMTSTTGGPHAGHASNLGIHESGKHAPAGASMLDNP